MPYFAIKERTSKLDICVCESPTVESIEAERMLGPGDWVIREINENEAQEFAKDWYNGQNIQKDACIVCGSPRVRILRGLQVYRLCKDCGYES